LDDVPTCLLGWCCPCYLFGKNAEKLDGSNKIGMCFVYATLSSCLLCSIAHRPRRQKLRANYNLEENPNDFVATCFFGSCANCQEARELTEQGLL
jgi:Cys-rich protein (TIGR01571 family)